MLGKILSKLTNLDTDPFVGGGPLLDALRASGDDLEAYRGQGGYTTIRDLCAAARPESVTARLDEAGLRGRAGGGFPTGHKWALVQQDEADERYFVCNAHAAPPRGFKERWLLNASPHRVIESMLVGMHAVRAEQAILYVGQSMEAEEASMIRAIDEAKEAGLLGDASIEVVRSTGGFVTGEETAMLDVLEGGPGQPRVKPPMPTVRGYRDKPTAISNLETLLQAFRILESGTEAFRAAGTRYAPGTQIVTLSGAVNRPGLYEMPLDTTARALIDDYGQGLVEGEQLLALLPGGLHSPPLGAAHLELVLDYDGLADARSSAGTGSFIVVSDATDPVDLAIELQRFFHDASCGKCQPCKDGTLRALTLLENLDAIDQQSIDLAHRERPESPRKKGGLYVVKDDDIIGGLSYTDSVEGLEKIRVLTEFYRYRGDCNHPAGAARTIQRFVELFPEAFEARCPKPSEAQMAAP